MLQSMVSQKADERQPKKEFNKRFKVMVIKVLTNIGRRMDEHSENFNKEIANIRKYQTEVKTGLKNTLAEKYSRMDEKENESVSREKKQWNSPTQSSKIKKKKFFFLSDNVLRDSWDNTKRYKNLRMRREREKARKVI